MNDDDSCRRVCRAPRPSPSEATGLSPRSWRSRKKRVGLIGCGWYGKCDLWRLLQIAPVEIVLSVMSTRRMLAEAAELAAAKQPSGKAPRTYADYREMLKEKDLDLVLVETPDHWHALPMIAAVQSGADVYVQKPISVDIIEGQSMLAAARNYRRVVQVGTQRAKPPAPHRSAGPDHSRGTAREHRPSGDLLLLRRPGSTGPPDAPPPDYLDWEMYTGRHRCVPTTR